MEVNPGPLNIKEEVQIFQVHKKDGGKSSRGKTICNMSGSGGVALVYI
jgi:hypothetical protein